MLPEIVLESIVTVTPGEPVRAIPPPVVSPWLPEIVEEEIVLSSVKAWRERPPPLVASPPETVLRSRMSFPPIMQRLPPDDMPKPAALPPVSVLSAIWRVAPLPPPKPTLPPHPIPEASSKTPAVLSEITLLRIVRFSPFE